jgi:hypothetical protein
MELTPIEIAEVDRIAPARLEQCKESWLPLFRPALL